ncbi:uncharacterized protein LOC119079929 isoform X2 [Bradysia coprophila]|uniref:uncharacterized protein LOC119079929 isoform X2 n=1 Tax=Bradysia coprophila TaxID=38358 RepID=UPI00187D8208|nr:uncharacterized protein LOC119079929 isoform X2 [Bradysia coprophila]
MATIDPKPLEDHLKRISSRFISINKDVKTAFRQHYNNISDYMIQSMKERDNVFKELFQEVKLAGSYADEIKVTAPNEFDTLIILKFPKPNPVSSVPGFVTINISDGINKWRTWVDGNEGKYRRLVDTDGFVIQDGVLDWLRVLVRDILGEQESILRVNGAEYYISQTNHGPAITLDVNVRSSTHGGIGDFSIDLVPALQFQVHSKWVADKQAKSIVKDCRFWNTIPKPNKLRLHKNRDWICSYAEIERDLLNGRNRLKPLIRIFKKIRDKVKLENLKSYYIKTILLHQRLQKPDDYWNGTLSVLFLEMFDVILKHFQTKTLWSLWHNNYNLLSQLRENQIDAIYLNLKSIKDTMVKNLVNEKPDLIYKQILTSDEFTAMDESERKEAVPKVEEERAAEEQTTQQTISGFIHRLMKLFIVPK